MLVNFDNKFVVNCHPIRHEPFRPAFLVPSVSALVGLIGIVIPFLRHTFIDWDRLEKGPMSMAAIPWVDDYIRPIAISDCKIGRSSGQRCRVSTPSATCAHCGSAIANVKLKNGDRSGISGRIDRVAE